MPKQFMNSDARNHLAARMTALGIREQDLREHFVRSGGHGGQNVNKVSTCVVLTHVPSGLSVRCDEERTQGRNRYLARKRLADRWEALARAKAEKEKHAFEKQRRQKRKRSRSAKEKMLKQKHHRSEIKKNRGDAWRHDQ